MILLNAIWLFALAALSIPVAIHLWNIRPGKTLKVGSIALINASAQKSSRSLKLHDLLLLLLRCLLLALVAFVLTVPLWQKQIKASSLKGWVLMPRENIKESYTKFKPQIDSLNKAGYAFHYFNKGFEKADLDKAITDTNRLNTTDPASYWTWIQQLDQQVPPALPVYLFTPDNIRHFDGEKPHVSLNLHWQTYTPADSTSTWIEKAWLTNTHAIRIVQGSSKPGGTEYSNFIIQSGDQRNTPFTITTNNGQLTVGMKNADKQIVADTSTWRFAIYAEKNKPDAGYVKAALQAVIQFTGHKAVIRQYTDAAQIPAKQSWLFWLSEEPLNPVLAEKADHVFAYENGGKMKDINSWINDNEQTLSPQKIALYQLVIANDNNEKALWRDGFGHPVLSAGKQGNASVYHFYSRFDPAYNELVWSDDFPKMLLWLMVKELSGTDAKYERRTIPAGQLLPLVDTELHPSANKLTERTDLAPYAWLLLMLVFVAERWLAHKTASPKTSKRILQNG